MKKNFIFNTLDLNNLQVYNEIFSKNFNIYSVSIPNDPKDNTLIFVKDMNDEIEKKISNIRECIILVNSELKGDFVNNIILKVDNPRREYARILKYILDLQAGRNEEYKINSEGYIKGKNVEIGDKTIIEPFVFIGDNCKIGKNCVIKSGAKIRKNTIVGDQCVIKENCVIGDDGFGMERDNNGDVYRIPHLGGVVLGNNVEVGALVSIAQGTINPTIIEDDVKIDDCVFIAHNCKIGKGSYIIANAEVSGSVQIGEYSWIGPSASIIDRIKIGTKVTIGIGAVVIKNIPDNGVVAGNPADTTENLKKLKSVREKILKSSNIEF